MVRLTRLFAAGTAVGLLSACAGTAAVGAADAPPPASAAARARSSSIPPRCGISRFFLPAAAVARVRSSMRSTAP